MSEWNLNFEDVSREWHQKIPDKIRYGLMKTKDTKSLRTLRYEEYTSYNRGKEDVSFYNTKVKKFLWNRKITFENSSLLLHKQNAEVDLFVLEGTLFKPKYTFFRLLRMENGLLRWSPFRTSLYSVVRLCLNSNII